VKFFSIHAVGALLVVLLFPSCGLSVRQTEVATSDRVLTLVNLERAKRGLPKVVPEPGLREIAGEHGDFLAANVFPQRKKPTRGAAHAGFQERAKRAREERYYVLSEVVMVGYAGDLNAVAERTIAGWLRSPDHREAILNKDRGIMGIETRLPADGRYFVVGLLSNGKVEDPRITGQTPRHSGREARQER